MYVREHISAALGCFFIKGSRTAQQSKIVKKQMEIFRYQRVCDNSRSPQKWIFPNGFGDKMRLQNGFSLGVDVSVSPSVALLRMSPCHTVSSPTSLAETHKGTMRNPY